VKPAEDIETKEPIAPPVTPVAPTEGTEDAQRPQTVIVVTEPAGGYLNVRAAPSIRSAVVEQLADGAVVEVLEWADSPDGWYYTTHGWIKAEFTK
jgi:hypothetical protein